MVCNNTTALGACVNWKPLVPISYYTRPKQSTDQKVTYVGLVSEVEWHGICFFVVQLEVK